MSLVAGIIGMAVMIAFLGIYIVTIKAPPMIIIMVVVIGLMIWDFVKTIRQTNGGAK
ncbi:MAG: hypothetical protein ACREDZ_10845 [Kiloniellales bacterium]